VNPVVVGTIAHSRCPRRVLCLPICESLRSASKERSIAERVVVQCVVGIRNAGQYGVCIVVVGPSVPGESRLYCACVAGVPHRGQLAVKSLSPSLEPLARLDS
jgi:hypothetical protein